MSRSRSLLAVAAGAGLVALAALAWRSTNTAQPPIADRETAELATPSAEQLAALERAEAEPKPAIESQAGAAREALEVRTIQTRAASITVQPPKVASENRGMILVWCYLEASHASIEPEEIVLLASDGRALGRVDEQPKGTFRGLVSGSYSVLVRDSRFENVRVDSVVTGSHVLIDLVGTARVRPHALDGETGVTIAADTLRLVDFGREKEFPPDADGWFSGLPGGNLALRVRAPGYEDSTLELHGIRPGESREVELRFSRAGEIRGVVVSETSGAPMEGVYILVSREGAPDIWGELSGNRPRPMPTVPVRSDAQGRFAIRDLRLGEYSIGAGQGSPLESASQRVVLAAGERVKEVVLRIPEGCSLSGTLTVRGGDADWASLVGMRVLAQRPGAPDPLGLASSVAKVGAGGRFNFQDALPIGRIQVLLALQVRDGGYDQAPSPGTRVLGELDLHGGENECSFDVSDLVPGFADVEVVASGVEIDDGELLVLADVSGGAAERYDLRRGLGRIGPLLPGDYWVFAHGRETWLSQTPAKLHIERAESSRLRMELRLVRGIVTVQDEQGVALAEGSRLAVWAADGSGHGRLDPIGPKVGENGELELALEPGAYRIGTRSELALEWGAAGPVQRVLRIPSRR